MFSLRFRKSGVLIVAPALTASLITVSHSQTTDAGGSRHSDRGGKHHNDGFVRRDGSQLKLDGKLFRVAGTSNYYLMYKSPLIVDGVLEAAAEADFPGPADVGSLDIGDPNDPATSLRGPSDGVYFQYWDPVAGAPAYNDGPNGLARLDYVIARAGELGLKLVIPFVNNWNDFGGMDQYVRWRDISTPDDQTWYHDSFYTDPVIQQWYKDWIAHVLNRTNAITGLKYKDDPTIMTWELGNEPRCLSAGAYPRSPDCTTDTLINWVDEMSTHIKSIDRKHLVSVGDEGFYCIPGATHWTEDCSEGVDTVAFTRLKNIDVMSFHMYPDFWGTEVADHDTVVTAFDTPATVDATANDITYGRARLVERSLDLDPATVGKQTTMIVTGGTFVAGTDGTVAFTPDAGFVGRASVSYVVKDSKHRLSNEVLITVQVLPDPTAAIPLFTFESGTEGWAPSGGAGTLSPGTCVQPCRWRFQPRDQCHW